MWGGLVVVTVEQVGIGFLYPVIDQWAHGLGLVSGAAFGIVFSPHAKWAKVSVFLGRSVALVFAAFAITAAVLVARTTVADSLGSSPMVRHVIGSVAVTAPSDWTANGELADRDGLVIMTVASQPRSD